MFPHIHLIVLNVSIKDQEFFIVKTESVVYFLMFCAFVFLRNLYITQFHQDFSPVYFLEVISVFKKVFDCFMRTDKLRVITQNTYKTITAGFNSILPQIIIT